MAHTFNDADAPTRHHTQYFEMFAHRSLYHDGWRAVCPFPGSPVSQMYSSPFAFTGKVHTVTISLAGDSMHDEDEAKQSQARIAMARQ